MGKIVLLDEGTINKIAAGEVVERPSAVAKELIENAIDAGANAITVEVKGGGISFIRITDNGSGIEKDQISIAFERHATSKIRTAEDLLSVSSLGFRGEALASISAVSQVELVTKTRGELTGTRYVIEGGKEKSLEEIGCPEGTTFVIRNLFFNTPARRKFLKSAQTEASYISDLVERLAISHPGVSFKFLNNNQLKLNTSGNGNVKDILYHIYGREIAMNLLSVEKKSSILGMQGFIAKPIVSRGNRNYMNYFINGRYIKSPIINKAIEDAYKPYSMQHRYPMTALHFEIPSEYIDVNVHPTKMEIRFTNGQAVYQMVYDTISDILSGKEMIPEVTSTERKVEKKYEKNTAPEPFEVQRKWEEQRKDKKNTVVGKQLVEAAKVISKFEEIEKKQAKLMEESSYGKAVGTEEKTEEKSELKNNPVLGDNLFNSAENHDEKLKNETVFRKDENTHNKSELTKDTDTPKQKTGVEVALQTALTDNVIVNTDTNTIATIKSENKDEKNITEQQNLTETEKEEVIWDKTNSEQVSLFKGENHKLLSKEARKEHKIIGQLFHTYWIIEYQEKMFIVDQHAAHEKVLYERTMKALQDKTFASQLLQPPMILSLSMREEQALKQYLPKLEQLGFEIEAFGGREFSVRAVPANLFDIAQKDLLIELIDSLTEDIDIKKSNLIMEKVASMSCKAAVKGKMKLSSMEAEALIDELMELDNPYHCPHGRPVIISMSKYEIEKKFKRIL